MWICRKVSSAGKRTRTTRSAVLDHAVAGSMEGGGLVESALDNAAALIVRRLDLLPLGEELKEFSSKFRVVIAPISGTWCASSSSTCSACPTPAPPKSSPAVVVRAGAAQRAREPCGDA